jgi:colicin import membrane protein
MRTMRSNRITAGFLLLGAALAAGGVLAADAVPGAPPASASAPLVDSHARIADERAAANARFAAQERECRTRFIVSSCIEDAKRERRKELDLLRARQLVVDEARRRERASERRTELASKADEDAKRQAERSARAASAAASGAASQIARGPLIAPGRPRGPVSPASDAASAGASAVRARTPTKGLSLGTHPPTSAAEREAQAARSRATFETKQQRAAEHRDESATQAIRRMSTKTPASSLPAPSSASAAKR